MTLIASDPVAIGNSSSAGFSQVWTISGQDAVVGAGGAGSVGLVWQNGQTTLLPTVSGDQSGLATGVDSQGQIVGYSYTGDVYHSILWQNGVATLLPTLGSSSRIFGINDQGVIVGSAEDSNGLAVAVEIDNGSITQLGVLPGGYLDNVTLADSRAFAINDAGQAVGLSMTQSGIPHAVLWQNGTITDLGIIAGGGQSTAYTINASGVIAGFAEDAAGIDHATVWRNGAMTVLPDLQSNGQSGAFGINDAGLVVGYADLYTAGGWQSHAVLWQNGALIDLNTLLPADSGWVLNIAHGINDNGEIAGMGTFDGVSTAFVLAVGDSAGPMVSASAALQAFQAAPHSQPLAVLDSAADIQSNFDGLEGIAAAGKLLTVQFTDAGTPTLSITAAQDHSDFTLIAALKGNVVLAVDASQPNVDINGPGTVATVAVFSGIAADYSISAQGGSVFTVTDTGTGRASSDTLDDVTALQFKDGTDFVVQAPSATGVTSGNVAELYAAVLGRTPDVSGLAYYQQLIQGGQGPSMLQLAQYFLNSSEYRNNPGHDYAQGAAGDAQFIGDIYQNLLHRSPDSGAVPYYQAVIENFTSGLAPGTAAYTAAELQGHAQVLVYFSASAEFLNDVQITAQHPADAQHWLYVL